MKNGSRTGPVVVLGEWPRGNDRTNYDRVGVNDGVLALSFVSFVVQLALVVMTTHTLNIHCTLRFDQLIRWVDLLQKRYFSSSFFN